MATVIHKWRLNWRLWSLLSFVLLWTEAGSRLPGWANLLCGVAIFIAVVAYVCHIVADARRPRAVE